MTTTPKKKGGRYFPLESFSPGWDGLISAALIRAQELEFPDAREAKLFQIRFHNYRASVRKHKPMSEAARFVYRVRSALRGNTVIIYKADEEFDAVLQKFDPEHLTVARPSRSAPERRSSKILDIGPPSVKDPVVEDTMLTEDELFAGLEDL